MAQALFVSAPAEQLGPLQEDAFLKAEVAGQLQRAEERRRRKAEANKRKKQEEGARRAAEQAEKQEREQKRLAKTQEKQQLRLRWADTPLCPSSPSLLAPS